MNGEDARVIYLCVKYIPETNEVVIEANSDGWDNLLGCIADLKERRVIGSHYHFDESAGMDGNVSSLIVGYSEANESRS